MHLTDPMFLGDQDTASDAQVELIIREQLDTDYTMADRLRSAVWYCPKTMTVTQFVAAAVRCGVNPGTARNRFHEARKQQIELDAL